MNCLEYRRLMTIEPGSRDPELLEHAGKCAACATFNARLQRFEHNLGQTLAVEAPEGLESRILLRQSVKASRARRAWNQRIYAVAATMLLTVGVVSGWMLTKYTQRVQAPLDQLVLNHIHDEEGHLHERNDVQLAELNQVVNRFGVRADALPAQVNFAHPCPMRKDKGAHLVLAGKQGPVTVLIIPGEQVRERTAVRDERFEGYILPTRYGALAIIGEHGEQLEEIQRALVTTMRNVT
ncbi:MAG: DUF3379 family protein [Pseudomonadota bacterium]|nr:MAG: DUF3379 family protein [Pseudomonadota bacterium]